MSKTELDRIVEDIGKCLDVVDLVVVLLRFCREHSEAVLDANQDRRKRARSRDERTRLRDEATRTFTSVGLSEKTKKLAIDKLKNGSDLAVTARALALGIGDAVQSRDPTAYGQWRRRTCAVGELKDGEPYPTPSVDLSSLSSMYGISSGFSSRPATNAGTAFDRVEGLALWRQPSRLRVIYDTVAGNHLDNALGQTVDILAVTPNEKWWEEFKFKELTEQYFFGARLRKPRLQNEIVQAALRTAIDLKADIVVTSELSSTTSTVDWIKRSTAGGRPPIVIAGGTHFTENGKRRNRMSTIYTGPDPLVVDHDKIGDYKFPLKVGGVRYELDEAIDRSRKLRIHAGLTWSMIPLICADFLEPDVVDAVSHLCPRLVVVPSMSPKTGKFAKLMGQVITRSQALVVVVNGPRDWGDATPPVAVIGMPLEDSREWIIEWSPEKSDKPPYKVHFRSQHRKAQFIT